MSDPIQAAENVLARWKSDPAPRHDGIPAIRSLEALLTHARTLEAELARLREPLGDGAALLTDLRTGYKAADWPRNGEEDYNYWKAEVLSDRAAAFITRQSAELARKTAVADAYWEIVESYRAENAELREAWAKVRAEIEAARDSSARGSLVKVGLNRALAILAQHTPQTGKEG